NGQLNEFTCFQLGIGIREKMLVKGCLGEEEKCLFQVEECRGAVDCGWGKPIRDTFEAVTIECVFLPPKQRFTFLWKKLIKNKEPEILVNDSFVLEVKREKLPVVYQCDTSENKEVIATVKFVVYSETDVEKRAQSRKYLGRSTMLVLISGALIFIIVVFAIVFFISDLCSVLEIWAS
uniref:Sperm acrosome associated 1 n=1 Tax=Latimeria chalumnae TaxID=7897 RepID=H3ACU9_LATCH